MSTAMSKSEREAFLAEAHIGVLSIPDGDSGPLSSPVWYDYVPGGDIWFLTQKTARKGQLLAVGTRVSLVAQNTDSPYKYVSIEGPVANIVPSDLLGDLQPMAQRYRGEQGGKDYAAALAASYALGNAIKVLIRPERWLTVDYAKRG
jgi:hypothetical protein